MCLYPGKGFFSLFFLVHIFKELLVSGKITLSWPWSFSRFGEAETFVDSFQLSYITYFAFQKVVVVARKDEHTYTPKMC